MEMMMMMMFIIFISPLLSEKMIQSDEMTPYHFRSLKAFTAQATIA